MLEQPKVQYRFQKHQEFMLDTIRMTFRFLMYDSFENLENIEPFSEKPKHTQEVAAEMLKQLYRYAVRSAMVAACVKCRPTSISSMRSMGLPRISKYWIP